MYKKYLTQENKISRGPDAFDRRIFYSKNVVKLNASMTSLFIYSDIVEHSIVGNAFAQLLKCVPITSKTDFGEVINIRYNDPDFIPLQSLNFDIIEIDIKDDTGSSVPFETGRVLIKLLFKKEDE